MGDRFLFVRTDADGAELKMRVERELLASRPDVELRGASCRTDDEVIEAARDADVLLTNESFITRGVLSSLQKLRAVVRYGIGYDRVDLEAATELGILIVNVPDFCQTEIANHVMTFILAWNKRLIALNAGVRAGDWVGIRRTINSRMGPTAGQLLGIFGFGNTGRMVAKKALALGMEVAAFSEHLTQADLGMGVRRMERDEMLRSCDFLSVNCALNAETYRALGAREFAMMKDSAVVINTARGAVLDEEALIGALRSGKIAGACLDVLEKEPPEPDNPLLAMENVLLTPHVAFYSSASVKKLAESVVREALLCITPGQRPVNVVNKQVLQRPNRLT